MNSLISAAQAPLREPAIAITSQPISVAAKCGAGPAASAPSSRPSVSSIGHLSRVRPIAIVTTVSHTVCTSTQPWRRLRSDGRRVMRPAAISAVRARSIACRIVSISESVSTSSFFAITGAASARDEAQRRPSGEMQEGGLHGERDDEQPQADERHVKRRRRARAFDAGGDLVRRAADDADPHQRHEDRERCDDASRPSECASRCGACCRARKSARRRE